MNLIAICIIKKVLKNAYITFCDNYLFIISVKNLF